MRTQSEREQRKEFKKLNKQFAEESLKIRADIKEFVDSLIDKGYTTRNLKQVATWIDALLRVKMLNLLVWKQIGEMQEKIDKTPLKDLETIDNLDVEVK